MGCFSAKRPTGGDIGPHAAVEAEDEEKARAASSPGKRIRMSDSHGRQTLLTLNAPSDRLEGQKQTALFKMCVCVCLCVSVSVCVCGW